jgi:hypothetical protein
MIDLSREIASEALFAVVYDPDRMRHIATSIRAAFTTDATSLQASLNELCQEMAQAESLLGAISGAGDEETLAITEIAARWLETSILAAALRSELVRRQARLAVDGSRLN